MSSSVNKKPLEFTRNAAEPQSNASEPRRKDFLFYLADGHSIEQACNLVGVTRKGYENWRARHKEFRKLVESARESHRRDIACGLHGADAYARMLLDAIQRDESLPAPLRYRASKTILTRKGKADWLPEPIPAESESLAPYDDEQPDYLTNDFPFQPVRAESESTKDAPASCGHGQSESEGTKDATASYGHGQSESASVARGGAPYRSSSPEGGGRGKHIQRSSGSRAIQRAERKRCQLNAGRREPEAGQPFNPFTPTALPPTPNLLQNPQNPVIETVEVAPQFSSDPFTSRSTGPTIREVPEAAQPQVSTNRATESPALPPESAGQKPEVARVAESNSSPSLSQQWLSNHFLHHHESKQAFEKLLANHIHTYQPATAPEELLVFRITQKSWLLRRVETWERVIADSRVAKIREKHPNAAAPACIAMSLLEVKESNQTRFYERTAKLRKEHEDALDRLESKLLACEQRREVAEGRAELRTLSSVRIPENQRGVECRTEFGGATRHSCSHMEGNSRVSRT